MAEDSFTEVTTQSWGSRIGGSIKGILGGVILFIIAVVLLFWNEGRTVKTYRSLKEGASKVISVSATDVNAENDGSLVHVSGMAKTPAQLKDPVFGVTENALKLQREVEMYQWQEHSSSQTEKKVGGKTETTTTYSYDKGWSSSLNKSSNFKKPEGHENPASMPYEDETWIAETATLGSFTLTESLISKMDFWEKISPNNPPSSLPNATISDGTLYSGDPASPQIGDIRVSFRVVLPGLVSIVAEQQGNTFKPYTTKNGRTIEMVSEGNVPADDMFAAAQKGNKQMGWILRLVGFVIMFIGLGLVFKPLSVVMDVLPILGDITGMATGFIAFMLSVVFSFITIAVAWIFYRPVFGVILLAVAIGIIVYLRMKKGEASA